MALKNPFKDSLANSLFINTSIVLLLLLISLVGLFLWLEKLDYQRDIERFESDFMQENREMVKAEVNDVLEYVKFRDNGLLAQTKNNVKSRVENVYAIIEQMYTNMHANYSENEVIKEIVETIQPLNLNKSAHYFFINSLDGYSILYPPDPSLEGKNLLEAPETNQNKVMQHMIETAQIQGNGFVSYKWPHPEKNGGLYNKITYIQTFEPLGIFIGSGDYIIEIENKIKQETLNWISKLRFGNEGYIFVLDSEGFMLSHIDPEYDDTTLLEYRDPEGFPVVKEIIKVAKSDEKGGFLQYLWRKPSTGNQAPKLSFVKYYESWDWVFGAGVYLDSLQQQIDSELALYRNRMWTRIWVSFGIFVSIAALSIVLILFMSKKVERSLQLFADFFQNAVTTYTLINPASLKYQEFKQIAMYANTMVKEYNQAQKSMQLSLNEKETLLKEVHHRVKNNLQLISSILNLQSSHLKEDALLHYFKESQSRIFTIASVHEELYESANFSKVDLDAYIGRIVPDLVHLYSEDTIITYDIEADSVFVELSTAIPLGLILNEIITNSIQHAFPQQDSGHISIQCKEQDDFIVFSIEDNGIGIPRSIQENKPHTLGIQLIDTLVQQINGTYSVTNETGCLVIIHIPKKEINNT